MTDLVNVPRFTCASCGESWMVMALDAEAEGRALSDWSCPECSPLLLPVADPTPAGSLVVALLLSLAPLLWLALIAWLVVART